MVHFYINIYLFIYIWREGMSFKSNFLRIRFFLKSLINEEDALFLALRMRGKKVCVAATSLK